jgi:hypothetical protein
MKAHSMHFNHSFTTFGKLITFIIFPPKWLRHFGAWSRSTMDSIRVSEALDSGSIPDETTKIE